MKISFITTYDALDVHNWSGIAYYFSKSLEKDDVKLDYVGNLQSKESMLFQGKGLFYKFRGLKYLQDRDPSFGKYYAAQVSKRISSYSDVVLSPGTIPIAYLHNRNPKVFYTDATFAGMLGFYDTFSNLCAESIKFGHELEQRALSSSSLAIYSSDWAAKTALDNYEVDPQKVKVVPFGANFESSISFNEVKSLISKRPRKICRLLFLGVDWERKGGDLALKIAKALNGAGLQTELHIAGVKSLPFKNLPEFVIDHGFISKATTVGRNALERLLYESHFLVLPTKAEAYGCVFCEANSFGVPNIATEVGGIPTIVKENVNGKLFPLSATENAYSNYILGLFNDYSSYEKLALSSFNEYRRRLNWTIAGNSVLELIKDLK